MKYFFLFQVWEQKKREALSENQNESEKKKLNWHEIAIISLIFCKLDDASRFKYNLIFL